MVQASCVKFQTGYYIMLGLVSLRSTGQWCDVKLNFKPNVNKTLKLPGKWIWTKFKFNKMFDGCL